MTDSSSIKIFFLSTEFLTRENAHFVSLQADSVSSGVQPVGSPGPQ